jgi:hypothetical protein
MKSSPAQLTAPFPTKKKLHTHMDKFKPLEKLIPSANFAVFPKPRIWKLLTIWTRISIA